MKSNNIKTTAVALLLLALLYGCQVEDNWAVDPAEEKISISLSGDINQLAVTRASDNGFASGDQVGIWAVNYDGDTPGTLTLKDNQATNVRFTFDGASTWTSDYDIYYKDKNTKVDLYGYYPFHQPSLQSSSGPSKSRRTRVWSRPPEAWAATRPATSCGPKGRP